MDPYKMKPEELTSYLKDIYLQLSEYNREDEPLNKEQLFRQLYLIFKKIFPSKSVHDFENNGIFFNLNILNHFYLFKDSKYYTPNSFKILNEAFSDFSIKYILNK